MRQIMRMTPKSQNFGRGLPRPRVSDSPASGGWKQLRCQGHLVSQAENARPRKAPAEANTAKSSNHRLSITETLGSLRTDASDHEDDPEITEGVWDNSSVGRDGILR
jgi:hypothetical protein